MGRRGLPHTACHRGKKVLVKLRDGTEFVARFHDRTDKYVFMEGHPRIPKSEILSFTIYKKA